MSGLYRVLLLSTSFVWLLPVQAQEQLPLKRAEVLAISQEPGVQALRSRAEALTADAEFAAQLPDPGLEISTDNLPIDTFDINQEPMTQIKLGINQKIPSLGKRKAKQSIRLQQSDAALSMADERQLQILKSVRIDWLELYYWQQAQSVVVESKTVLAQLLAVVNSLYKVGKKDQHDLLRAELELSKLNDRQLNVADEIARRRARLGRWIGEAAEATASGLPAWNHNLAQAPADNLVTHPLIRALDRQVDVGQHTIELAQSNYKPDWGISLSYGYRNQDFNGRELPDFFSAGVSVQLPLFTDKRQDKTYRASVQRHQAAISERLVQVRALRAELQDHQADGRHLKQRFTLYKNTIMKQARQQADAALKAYRSDSADFTEAMRAVLAELDIRLEYQRLRVDHLQSLAQIKYLIEYDELKELTL